MRDAATFDHDVGFEASVRKAAPRKPRGPGKTKKKGRRFNVDMSRVARYAAIGMSATVAVGIMVNALLMQKGHHPAPLFGKAIALGEPAAPPTPAAASRMVPADAGEPAPAAAEVPAPPPKPRPLHAPGDDPIARLLKGSADAAPAEKADPKTVLGVQQALVRLGYVLKPNGTLGPATKKALELFEKDRHLPAKGELSRRVVKILSAESGVKID